jgi:hypothetical protein
MSSSSQNHALVNHLVRYAHEIHEHFEQECQMLNDHSVSLYTKREKDVYYDWFSRNKRLQTKC